MYSGGLLVSEYTNKTHLIKKEEIVNYKIIKCGKERERRNYSKSIANVELPDLISIQKDSFKWFKEEGLKALFNEYSPITDPSGRYEMIFHDYEFLTPE